MQEHPLPKIGPGLGSRSRIWGRVQQKLPFLKYRHTNSKTNEEILLIQRLAEGNTWTDFIPPEWIDIYDAYFEETKSIPLPEREIAKIDKDVPRTFGLFVRNARLLRLNFPADLSSYYNGLRDVLIAVSRDRGYCQGINFIAASILLHTHNVRQATIILNFLLKHRKLEILFDPKYSALMDYMRIFEKRLRKFVPNVYHHFKKCEFTVVSYAIEWFTTCFIVTSPGELSNCVLDLLIAGFEDIMIRVGLGLLKVLEDKLLRLDFEGLHQQFKHLVMTLDSYEIMVQALPIVVPRRMSLLEGMSLKIDALGPSTNGNLKFSGSGGISLQQNSDHVSDSASSSEKSVSYLSEDEGSNNPVQTRRNPKKLTAKLAIKINSSVKFLKRASKSLSFKKKNVSSIVRSKSSPLVGIPVDFVPPSQTNIVDNTSNPQEYNRTVSRDTKDVRSGGDLPIANWWNNTWKNSLFNSTAVNQQQYSSNPPVQNLVKEIATDKSSSQKVETTVSLPKASGSSTAPFMNSFHENLQSSSISWKNSCQQQSNVSSPVPKLDSSVSFKCDYDGDSEPNISELRIATLSRTEDNAEFCEEKSPSAHSGMISPSVNSLSSCADRQPQKLRHKLLLLEHSAEKFEEKNIEDAFLDQGGEVLLAENHRSNSSENPSQPVNNFRIAAALETLHENWFPELPPRKKSPKKNMKVRAKHKTRKPQEIDILLTNSVSCQSKHSSNLGEMKAEGD